MAVDFDLFYKWAKDRFGEDNLRVKETDHGTEVMTHSFYAHQQGIEDHKYHLWMNPSGGKSKHPENGSFRCWKTHLRGSLVRLVADWDKIPYEDAEELISGVITLRDLERKVHEFFGHKEPDVEAAVAQLPVEGFQLPDCSFLIDSLSKSSFNRIKAKKFLDDRKIPSDGLYIGTAGDYKDRIIIPYYDRDGRLIFYNGRTMSNKKSILRYRKCDLDQDNVLFMQQWPPVGSKIYITEGEFDAIVLTMAGFHGCACGGADLSASQIELIRGYIPVIATDADDGGLTALVNIGNDLLEKGFGYVGYVRPPKVYKDWNKLLLDRNIETVRAYVHKYEKRFTSDTSALLASQKLG